MDLLTKKPQQSAVISVIDPDSYGKIYEYGKGNPVDGMTYTLAHTNSPEFRAAQSEAECQTNAEDKNIDVFAGAITDWTGFEEGGEPLACDMETKRRILKTYDWLAFQVIETITTRQAFFPPARNASASSQPSALGVRSRSGK